MGEKRKSVKFKKLQTQILRILKKETSGDVNDKYLRKRLVDLVEHEIKNYNRRDRHIYNFSVVCDDTNNPPAVVDSNDLYLDVWLFMYSQTNTIWWKFSSQPVQVHVEEIKEEEFL